jgi:hypothetical protein
MKPVPDRLRANGRVRHVSGRVLSASILVLIVGNVSADPGSEDSHQWLLLDTLGEAGEPHTRREADVSTLRRDGPWAIFKQRFIGVVPGQAEPNRVIDEVMAVNCLSGSFGAIEYWKTADDGQTRERVTMTLPEVDTMQWEHGRLSLIGNNDHLQQRLIEVACSCAQRSPAASATDAELHGTYENYLRKALLKRRYHVRFIRVQSQQSAKAIVERLDRGESFSALADRYSEAKEFPGGDIGFDAAGSWTLADRRLFDGMRPGEYMRAPREGIFGWELFQLVEIREDPAPEFTTQRDRVAAYVSRAKACGWQY